jgi:hypothetical protein
MNMREPNDCHGDESDLELLRRMPERDPDEDYDADWHGRMLADELIQNRNRDVMEDIGRALMPDNFKKIMGRS